MRCYSGDGYELLFEASDQPADIRAFSADYTTSEGSDTMRSVGYPTFTRVKVQVD